VLWVALHFPHLRSQALARGHASPEAEREALAAVATWLGRFTPRVTLEPPQAVLAELQGSLRLFGGAPNLVAQIRAGVAALGFEASVTLARTARAAAWRAAGGGQPLPELSVAVAGLDAGALELLAGLGVRTLGELMRLPREGVARRFGQALAEDLDRALGKIPEPRRWFSPPPRFDARLELPAQASEAESVLFAARRLLAQMEGFLAARHAGARGFALALEHGDAPPSRIEIGLATPAREAGHFTALLRERLGRTGLAAPVEAIRLQARDLAPLAGANNALFGDARAGGEQWARLVERLEARLGNGAVHGLELHAEHRPELAWRAVGASPPPGLRPSPSAGGRRAKGEPSPLSGGQTVGEGPRPLWLLEPPRRLAENAVALLAGPERIESGWWDGGEVRRDYFIAQARDGALVWVYRQADGWFLHGIFA
jgi:protein ImuB